MKNNSPKQTNHRSFNLTVPLPKLLKPKTLSGTNFSLGIGRDLLKLSGLMNSPSFSMQHSNTYGITYDKDGLWLRFGPPSCRIDFGFRNSHFNGFFLYNKGANAVAVSNDSVSFDQKLKFSDKKMESLYFVESFSKSDGLEIGSIYSNESFKMALITSATKQFSQFSSRKTYELPVRQSPDNGKRSEPLRIFIHTLFVSKKNLIPNYIKAGLAYTLPFRFRIDGGAAGILDFESGIITVDCYLKGQYKFFQVGFGHLESNIDAVGIKFKPKDFSFSFKRFILPAEPSVPNHPCFQVGFSKSISSDWKLSLRVQDMAKNMSFLLKYVPPTQSSPQ